MVDAKEETAVSYHRVRRDARPEWVRRVSRDFRAFVLRGSMVELAVAVVIGAASQDVIRSVISDLVMPAFAAIGGKPEFEDVRVGLGSVQLHVGRFLNAFLSWLLVTGIVFFAVVRPTNALRGRLQTELDVDSRTRPCPECLSQIPVKATRCAFCTAVVPVESPTAAMAIAGDSHPSTSSGGPQ